MWDLGVLFTYLCSPLNVFFAVGRRSRIKISYDKPHFFWRPRGSPRPPNYPLLYPKYPLLRTIRAPLKGTWGVMGSVYGFIGSPQEAA